MFFIFKYSKMKCIMRKIGGWMFRQQDRNNNYFMEEEKMKHIKTVNKANLSATAKKGGCGKCQASCQSACKTSCTVGNQKCANEENK